jgi:mRNA deadenylase 3'-5' endonuclease subunit Ccr4
LGLKKTILFSLSLFRFLPQFYHLAAEFMFYFHVWNNRWKARSKAVLAELKSFQADLMCIQVGSYFWCFNNNNFCCVVVSSFFCYYYAEYDDF